MDIEILDLWPTKLIRKTVPDCQEANRELLELIGEWDKRTPDLTTDYRDNNPFDIDSPPTNWLRGHVNGAIVEYLGAIAIDYALDWHIHGWANVNRNGDYHDPHNHPYSYLSGTYYVKVPGDGPKRHQRSDVRPNRITFHDPRGAFNMQAIGGDPYVDPEFTVLPHPGLLMLWPGALMHFVHPNLSDQKRVSISFNIVLKRANEQLPRQ